MSREVFGIQMKATWFLVLSCMICSSHCISAADKAETSDWIGTPWIGRKALSVAPDNRYPDIYEVVLMSRYNQAPITWIDGGACVMVVNLLGSVTVLSVPDFTVKGRIEVGHTIANITGPLSTGIFVSNTEHQQSLVSSTPPYKSNPFVIKWKEKEVAVMWAEALPLTKLVLVQPREANGSSFLLYDTETKSVHSTIALDIPKALIDSTRIRDPDYQIGRIVDGFFTDEKARRLITIGNASLSGQNYSLMAWVLENGKLSAKEIQSSFTAIDYRHERNYWSPIIQASLDSMYVAIHDQRRPIWFIYKSDNLVKTITDLPGPENAIIAFDEVRGAIHLIEPEIIRTYSPTGKLLASRVLPSIGKPVQALLHPSGSGLLALGTDRLLWIRLP